jgi:ribA/ribD-fused uncharacterized protein
MATGSNKKTINEFKGEYFFLSNFYANAPFEWRGHKWMTGEHAFQAAKAYHPGEAFKIRDCSSPSLAKRLGRAVRLVGDWDHKKIAIMGEVLKAKFCPVKQPAMAARLLLTGDATLVEGNTWGDQFWGVDMLTGRGQNQLGLALMILRDEIRAKSVGLEGLV